MVEVFKTNVNEESISNEIHYSIMKCFPNSTINFDLQDCDKILRIEAEQINSTQVISILSELGYNCEILN